MKSESETQKNIVDEKGAATGTQPTVDAKSSETKPADTKLTETKTANKDVSANAKAGQQTKRIRYTKQEMMALAKERVSLQRPPNLPQEPIFRRYRDNTTSSNSSNSSNAKEKEKPVEKEREVKEPIVAQKVAERQPPKQQPKVEPKPRKDRYGTPSWFTEEINSSEAFQFGTLDREADKAQMAKAAKTAEAAKPESEVEEEEEEDDHENGLEDGANEPTEPPAVTMKLAPTSRSQSAAEPHPPTEPELLPLERLGIRDPSRESSYGKEAAGPWNSTWPSLFGSFFPGFSNEPPRHDPWSSPPTVPAEAPKVSSNVPASSASDQTAALKSMLRIGGMNLGAKPVAEAHLHQQPAGNAEWGSGVSASSSSSSSSSLSDGWPKQEQEVLTKISPQNWSQPHQDNHSGSRGWSDSTARDAEWREGIAGWQQETGWPEQAKPRAEWVSREPRALHHDGEEVMTTFKGQESFPSSTSASINAFSANAATVAKRSNLSVQALLSMNLPNRNPMPHNAVLVSTLENRQLVRAAAERERSLEKSSRPTVSFTPSPAETYAAPRLDQQAQDPMAEHMARMVSKAHMRKAAAPLASSNAPSVTFSNRPPPMRYPQNQFASSSARQPSYMDQQQQPLSPQQMFYQQNSPYSMPNAQQPNLAALPPSHAARASFTAAASVSGTGLEKWFGHMLQKPNSH